MGTSDPGDDGAFVSPGRTVIGNGPGVQLVPHRRPRRLAGKGTDQGQQRIVNGPAAAGRGRRAVGVRVMEADGGLHRAASSSRTSVPDGRPRPVEQNPRHQARVNDCTAVPGTRRPGRQV